MLSYSGVVEHRVTVATTLNELGVDPYDRLDLVQTGATQIVVHSNNFLEYVEVEVPSYLGRLLGILGRENPESVLIDDELKIYKRVFNTT